MTDARRTVGERAKRVADSPPLSFSSSRCSRCCRAGRLGFSVSWCTDRGEQRAHLPAVRYWSTVARTRRLQHRHLHITFRIADGSASKGLQNILPARCPSPALSSPPSELRSTSFGRRRVPLAFALRGWWAGRASVLVMDAGASASPRRRTRPSRSRSTLVARRLRLRAGTMRSSCG